MPAEANALVLGVAVVVPEPFRSELASARRRYDAPGTVPIPPHITLLPPTTIEEWQREAVLAHLGRVADSCPPFDVRLRGTATFRPVSPVVFVSVVDGISGCERLERGVRSGVLLRRRPFPYHPHVTVAHDVPDEVLDGAFDDLDTYSARFRVDSFTLARLTESGEWDVVREFPLRGSPLLAARSSRV